MSAAMMILGYWNIRGLAQPCRLLLNYAGVTFEDKYYVTGPAPAYDKSAWLKEKAENPYQLDFPNLPFLVDGDVKLTQTHAIIRYLGRKYDLVGTNETEVLRCELAEQQMCDLRTSFVSLSYSPEADFNRLKPERMKLFKTMLKQFSAFLGDRDWMAGSKLTYADFLCYEIFFQLSVFMPEGFEGLDNLKAYVKRFEKLPAIEAYMKSDRFLKWPFNNNVATFGSRSTPCPF